MYLLFCSQQSSECTPKPTGQGGRREMHLLLQTKPVPKACTAPTSSSEERSREETVGAERECLRTKPPKVRVFTDERWTNIKKKHNRSECKDWIFFLVPWKDSSSLVRGMKCPQCAGQQRAIILSHRHTVLKVANRTAEAQGAHVICSRPPSARIAAKLARVPRTPRYVLPFPTSSSSWNEYEGQFTWKRPGHHLTTGF